MTTAAQLQHRLGQLHAAVAFQVASGMVGTRVRQADRRYCRRCLYFIRCGDAIKVGVSDNPESRLKTLQTGAPGPLELIASIPNAGHLEKWCHKKLAHLSINGEWFLDSPEIHDLVRELRSR